jgi:hypothetical protein
MTMKKSFCNSGNDERGTATLMAVLAVAVLLGLTGAMLIVTHRNQGERTASLAQHRSFYAANSGIGHVLNNLHAGNAGSVGTADAPVDFAGGSYFADVQDNGDGTFTVTSTGNMGQETIALEAVITAMPGGIFNNAIFAGTTSNDPLYTMELGGLADQADAVSGDIYSAGDVSIAGDATVSGTIRAGGEIEGASGETDVTLPIPDLAAMDYANTADFDVAALFAGSVSVDRPWGGTAREVPESNPAHIFRRNPSDRRDSTSTTAKNDYFLEDPYETFSVDSDSNGDDAFQVSQPGVNGNQKVYYIDGNLWIHNKRTMSFKIEHDEPNGVQVTIVVKGNIYISDNIFYDDPTSDGLALIAMKDSAVTDSGNIYFGDPAFGTLEEMHSFMYAENNFIDNNLDEEGSADVRLFGNMTAGNQVVIDRDYGDQHSKLTVDFDDRIATGALEMPRLPLNTAGDGQGFEVVSWRKVPLQ